ncbi:MAG: NADH-quinone oxidoreductase subunit NuoF [Bacteroidota bacterium]|nr:NADH-quinone oxidoreductase subunit NuoF [Bacteroidota bacterium]
MQEYRIALKNIGKYNGKSINAYIKLGGFSSLMKILNKMTCDTVVQEITKSGLRGRGGAGFPTGLKFEYTANEKGEEKYVICNADEGEPGTFKDRQIMEQDPYLLLEGIIIAAFAIGAHKGYIYIRGEYYKSIERIQNAINNSLENGFLGNNILGSNFNFNIEVKIGGGSYLCGEELALIESLEGKRGQPRIKPPFPAQKGLFQKPTLVNNVETLCHLPDIITNGSDWYKSIGTNGSTGTKIFSISGDVTKPGYYEYEFGVSLRELIFNVAGGISNNKQIKAILLGGAAGTFVSPQQLDIAMDFDSLKDINATLGSGAIIVLHEDRDIKDFLENILSFFKHESCGKCVPCRIGTSLLHKYIQEINSGTENPKLLLTKMLKEAKYMRAASLCPLGQSPILPISSAMKYFENELINK